MVKFSYEVAPRFKDRYQAGRFLAEHLYPFAQRPDTIVLALPRGGVPVAFEVARELAAPLDVYLVRKLGVPTHPELAMGAIASGGVRVINDEVVDALSIPASVIEEVAEKERYELDRRERAYRGGVAPLSWMDRIAILIDDGMATGSTMTAAVRGLRQKDPAQVVVAVPIAAVNACHSLALEADDVICPFTPEAFSAIGQWYEDFAQTSDEEVKLCLRRARGWSSAQHAAHP